MGYFAASPPPLEGEDDAICQCPLGAVACCSLFLLTCALLMTSSHSKHLSGAYSFARQVRSGRFTSFTCSTLSGTPLCCFSLHHSSTHQLPPLQRNAVELIVAVVVAMPRWPLLDLIRTVGTTHTCWHSCTHFTACSCNCHATGHALAHASCRKL